MRAFKKVEKRLALHLRCVVRDEFSLSSRLSILLLDYDNDERFAFVAIAVRIEYLPT